MLAPDAAGIAERRAQAAIRRLEGGPPDDASDDDATESEDDDVDMADRAPRAFGMQIDTDPDSETSEGEDEFMADVARVAEDRERAAEDALRAVLGGHVERGARRDALRGGQRLGGAPDGADAERVGGHAALAQHTPSPAELRALRAQRLAGPAPAEPAPAANPVQQVHHAQVPTLLDLCITEIGRRLFATDRPILRWARWKKDRMPRHLRFL